MKLSNSDIKTFNKFINEPNEFKRYILLNLFINQFFTETITETITKTLSGTNNVLSDEVIFNMMRDIKQSLIIQNENLKLAVNNMKNQHDIINVLNNVLKLDLNINDDKIKELEETINNNSVYIDKINNLSENQIKEYRSDDNNKSE